MHSKYWGDIKKEMEILKKRKLKDLTNKRNEAIFSETTLQLKNLFEEFKSSVGDIAKSKIKQVIVEELKPENGYGEGTAVILEWGNKLRINKKDLYFLNKFYKKKLIRLFRSTDVPPIITKTDYYFICFHINNNFISFPHDYEFEPIEINEFFKNPRVILPIIKAAISKPQYNNKILIKGIDYWK